MKKKVLVAMSGGVDSTVAAYLLKEQGYEVIGCTLSTWISPTCETKNTKACCGVKGIEDARASAKVLGIDYFVLECADEFEKLVIQNFKQEYLKGRTPNPCIRCNEHIKFNLPWQVAKERGIDFISTGHHARIHLNESTGEHRIQQGVDPKKDQSYVLFCLARNMLSQVLLPIGDLTKQEVRDIAKKQGLPVFDKPDSQEICFIPSHNYPKFLEKEYHVTPRQGAIVNQAGKVLGVHNGYFNFTIGQRKRLGVTAPNPLYVIDIRPQANEVVVGERDDIYKAGFRVEKITWHSQIAAQGEFQADVKIRSVHDKAPAMGRWEKDGALSVQFIDPQESVTPGQAAVFYEKDLVLGGGWIV